MTVYLNGLPDYEDVVDYTPERLPDQMKLKLDEKKLDALSAPVENWTEVLPQELDRLYQRQSENMVDVYNTIEQMKKTLEDDLED